METQDATSRLRLRSIFYFNLSLRKPICVIFYIVASKFISIPANLMVFAAKLIGQGKVATRSLSY